MASLAPSLFDKVWGIFAPPETSGKPTAPVEDGPDQVARETAAEAGDGPEEGQDAETVDDESDGDENGDPASPEDYKAKEVSEGKIQEAGRDEAPTSEEEEVEGPNESEVGEADRDRAPTREEEEVEGQDEDGDDGSRDWDAGGGEGAREDRRPPTEAGEMEPRCDEEGRGEGPASTDAEEVRGEDEDDDAGSATGSLPSELRGCLAPPTDDGSSEAPPEAAPEAAAETEDGSVEADGERRGPEREGIIPGVRSGEAEDDRAGLQSDGESAGDAEEEGRGEGRAEEVEGVRGGGEEGDGCADAASAAGSLLGKLRGYFAPPTGDDAPLEGDSHEAEPTMAASFRGKTAVGRNERAECEDDGCEHDGLAGESFESDNEAEGDRIGLQSENESVGDAESAEASAGASEDVQGNEGTCEGNEQGQAEVEDNDSYIWGPSQDVDASGDADATEGEEQGREPVREELRDDDVEGEAAVLGTEGDGRSWTPPSPLPSELDLCLMDADAATPSKAAANANEEEGGEDATRLGIVPAATSRDGSWIPTPSPPSSRRGSGEGEEEDSREYSDGSVWDEPSRDSEDDAASDEEACEGRDEAVPEEAVPEEDSAPAEEEEEEEKEEEERKGGLVDDHSERPARASIYVPGAASASGRNSPRRTGVGFTAGFRDPAPTVRPEARLDEAPREVAPPSVDDAEVPAAGMVARLRMAFGAKDDEKPIVAPSSSFGMVRAVEADVRTGGRAFQEREAACAPMDREDWIKQRDDVPAAPVSPVDEVGRGATWSHTNLKEGDSAASSPAESPTDVAEFWTDEQHDIIEDEPPAPLCSAGLERGVDVDREASEERRAEEEEPPTPIRCAGFTCGIGNVKIAPPPVKATKVAAAMGVEAEGEQRIAPKGKAEEASGPESRPPFVSPSPKVEDKDNANNKNADTPPVGSVARLREALFAADSASRRSPSPSTKIARKKSTPSAARRREGTLSPPPASDDAPKADRSAPAAGSVAKLRQSLWGVSPTGKSAARLRKPRTPFQSAEDMVGIAVQASETHTVDVAPTVAANVRAATKDFSVNKKQNATVLMSSSVVEDSGKMPPRTTVNAPDDTAVPKKDTKKLKEMPMPDDNANGHENSYVPIATKKAMVPKESPYEYAKTKKGIQIKRAPIAAEEKRETSKPVATTSYVPVAAKKAASRGDDWWMRRARQADSWIKEVESDSSRGHEDDEDTGDVRDEEDEDSQCENKGVENEAKAESIVEVESNAGNENDEDFSDVRGEGEGKIDSQCEDETVENEGEAKSWIQKVYEDDKANLNDITGEIEDEEQFVDVEDKKEGDPMQADDRHPENSSETEIDAPKDDEERFVDGEDEEEEDDAMQAGKNRLEDWNDTTEVDASMNDSIEWMGTTTGHSGEVEDEDQVDNFPASTRVDDSNEWIEMVLTPIEDKEDDEEAGEGAGATEVASEDDEASYVGGDADLGAPESTSAPEGAPREEMPPVEETSGVLVTTKEGTTSRLQAGNHDEPSPTDAENVTAPVDAADDLDIEPVQFSYPRPDEMTQPPQPPFSYPRPDPAAALAPPVAAGGGTSSTLDLTPAKPPAGGGVPEGSIGPSSVSGADPPEKPSPSPPNLKDSQMHATQHAPDPPLHSSPPPRPSAASADEPSLARADPPALITPDAPAAKRAAKKAPKTRRERHERLAKTGKAVAAQRRTTSRSSSRPKPKLEPTPGQSVANATQKETLELEPSPGRKGQSQQLHDEATARKLEPTPCEKKQPQRLRDEQLEPTPYKDKVQTPASLVSSKDEKEQAESIADATEGQPSGGRDNGDELDFPKTKSPAPAEARDEDSKSSVKEGDDAEDETSKACPPAKPLENAAKKSNARPSLNERVAKCRRRLPKIRFTSAKVEGGTPAQAKDLRGAPTVAQTPANVGGATEGAKTSSSIDPPATRAPTPEKRETLWIEVDGENEAGISPLRYATDPFAATPSPGTSAASDSPQAATPAQPPSKTSDGTAPLDGAADAPTGYPLSQDHPVVASGGGAPAAVPRSVEIPDAKTNRGPDAPLSMKPASLTLREKHKSLAQTSGGGALRATKPRRPDPTPTRSNSPKLDPTPCSDRIKREPTPGAKGELERQSLRLDEDESDSDSEASEAPTSREKERQDHSTPALRERSQNKKETSPKSKLKTAYLRTRNAAVARRRKR